VKRDILKKFGSTVVVHSIKDVGRTGNFKISVAGRVVHDKKKGDGDVDSFAKKENLHNAILEEMKKDDSNAPLVARLSIQPVQPVTIVEDETMKRRSLCMSIVTLLLSIPALIGA